MSNLREPLRFAGTFVAANQNAAVFLFGLLLLVVGVSLWSAAAALSVAGGVLMLVAVWPAIWPVLKGN